MRHLRRGDAREDEDASDVAPRSLPRGKFSGARWSGFDAGGVPQAMRLGRCILPVLLSLLLPRTSFGASADLSATAPPSPETWSHSATKAAAHPLFTHGDIWFAGATAASVVLAEHLDRWAADEAPENNGAVAVGVSRAAERLGNPLYVVPAFLFFRAADALEHRPDRAGSLTRIAEGAAAATVVNSVLKLAVGRARPYQTPGNEDVVRPFSGNSAFPSGHTALAFAIAAGIDQETRAKWVPYVVYPLAGLVGWSRMRDGKHWGSDVVAGASVGFWTARKVVTLARRAIRTP